VTLLLITLLVDVMKTGTLSFTLQTYNPLRWEHASLLLGAAVIASTSLLAVLPVQALSNSTPRPSQSSVAVATLTPGDVTQLQQLTPKTASDFYDLGVMLQGTGDLQGAVQNFSRAIELAPTADNYFARGLAYSDLGNPQKATADYTEAIRLDANFAAAYYNRGMAQMALQELTAAVDDFTQAIRVQPQFVAAYYNRGMAYYDLGKMAQARQDYTQAQQLGPTTTAVFYDRALRPQTGGGEE
jgi:tetratricopeptide (TPR) repeat protein